MEKYKGQIYVILSAMLFGFMPLLTKITYTYGSNCYSTAFGRFFFGSLVLLIICLIRKENLRITKKQLLEISGLAFLQGFTPVFLYMSYNYIDSGLSTTLHFTYPIMVMIISLVFFKERMDRKSWICLLLCIAGILCLYKPGSNNDSFGMIIAVFSGFLFSLYVVFLSKSHVRQIPLFVMSFYLTFIASQMVLVFSLLTHHLVFVSNMKGWLALLLLAFMATVLAVVFFQKGVFLCGSIQASMLSTFEPLTSVFVGLLVYQEVITFKSGLGVLFILISTVLLSLPGKSS